MKYMSLTDLRKEVLHSNLSDEAKFEVLKALEKEDKKQEQPQFVPVTIQPVTISYPEVKPWWTEITCMTDKTPGWDESIWYNSW